MAIAGLGLLIVNRHHFAPRRLTEISLVMCVTSFRSLRWKGQRHAAAPIIGETNELKVLCWGGCGGNSPGTVKNKTGDDVEVHVIGLPILFFSDSFSLFSLMVPVNLQSRCLHNFFLTIVAVMVFLALLSRSKAQNFWQSANGPIGGVVTAIAFDGTRVYAGLAGGGVYGSVDDGITWSAKSDGLSNLNVTSLVYGASVLYASTSGGGVFSSTDSGATWSPSSSGLTNPSVNTIAPNGSTIFAGTDGSGAFVSHDGGLNWDPVGGGLTANVISAFFFVGSKVFAATQDSGVYKSLNNGASWVATNRGLTNLDIRTILKVGSTLYAGSNGDGVFLSNNDGSNWTTVNNGLENTSVMALIVGGSDLYAATAGGGVYLSTNNGAQWYQRINGLDNPTLNTIFLAGSTLFVGTDGAGVYRSSNSGASWTMENTNVTGTDTRSFAGLGNRLLTATWGNGIFNSSDNGSTWQRTTAPVTGLYFYSLAVDGQKILAGTGGNGFFVSVDTGKTWVQENDGLTNGYVQSILVAGSVYFTGTSGGGVSYSTNGGNTWTSANIGQSNSDVTSLVASNAHLFAGTDGDGVFASTDTGTIWAQANSGLSNQSVNCLLFDGSYVFAGTEGGLFRSSDEGLTWTAANNGLTDEHVRSLLQYQSRIYAGLSNGSVFISQDEGSDWAEIKPGLAGSPAQSLFVTNQGYLFVGTAGMGAFRSTRSVTTPAQPVLAGPADGTTSEPVAVALSWHPASTAWKYDVQVATDQYFNAVFLDDTSSVDTTFHVSRLARNANYYWHVRATNINGWGYFSNTWTFATVPTDSISDSIAFPPNPRASTDYRLVSFPGEGLLHPAQLLSGQDDFDWKMYYDNGDTVNYLVELDPQSILLPGQGYWLLNKGKVQINRIDTMPPLSPGGTVTIMLRRGWNIIGNPFNAAVDWAAVLSLNGLTGASFPLYDYQGTGGYTISTRLDSLKGYYFDNTAAAAESLIIPYPFQPRQSPSKMPAIAGWEVQMALKTDLNEDNENYIGVRPDADDGLDKYDLRKPPLIFEQNFLYFSRRNWDPRQFRFSRDIRRAIREGQLWDFEVRNPQKTKTEIFFKGIDGIPAGFGAALINTSNTAPVDLRKENKFSFTPQDEITHFKLAVGKQSFIDRETAVYRPESFELGQNYPNPFNPTTVIGFAVPYESSVKLEIFNIIGEKVRTLVDRRTPSAYLTINWDGRDGTGKILPSGIYIYQLTADGHFIGAKKMAILR